jgi:hypothetical protein
MAPPRAAEGFAKNIRGLRRQTAANRFPEVFVRPAGHEIARRHPSPDDLRSGFFAPDFALYT